ncbi:MAG TPA: DUF1707 domain-containing protein [Capillimicrobium sp.]|nr:DUF1707 domain-containing protein [Capillimicrobium sp.]
MRAGAVVLVSDVEREGCARALHRAYADGRFGLDELERRLDRVHRARTRLELNGTLRGIPRQRLQRFGRAVDRADRLALKAHGTSVVLLNGSLVGIWELTGGGAFWPALALVPTGALFAWHSASSWTVRRLVRRRFG